MIMRALAAGAAVLVVAGSALAASDWAAPQLADMDASGFGAPVEGMTFEGSAPRGKNGRVAVVVPADGRYAFVAACGEDCADVGLILQKGGRTVAEGVPGFRADLNAGAHVLHVGFDRCPEAQCRYVVRAYRAG
ncbi:MAG TPA: hypothetical protein VD929_01515 [Caulobacteraceae bacterium]|nr:hypothetical protein [Caulobacteraceae bacterium]